ncbi:flippase [Bacillus sp. V59.32b]|uniref:flippase n=1 Tax=Bacillus sp. V59.32b TaxID=1758642 RepID=UPI000E3ED9C8|nr:flippase [Bacillus sp. V59.32b]RFU60992.1 flippase [Bacillus sp. V59.32b]
MSVSKIKILFSSKVMKNGSWLYILQIFNTLAPLLTLPYITRVLGASQFGVFSFSLNLIGYFQVIVEYGFNLSGSRKVAVARDKEEVERIYSAIMTSKVILCVATFFLMLLICQILSVNEMQFISMIVLYSMVIGLSLQQTWLFQGMQDMKYITIINVFARTLSVILIFLFVKEPSDIYIYCLLYAITFLLGGIISVIIIKNKLGIAFHIPSIKDVKTELQDGWYIFTTSAMTKVFSGFGITILGFTSTESSVGIFSAIQKIPIIISMMFAPIGQVIYPYISKYYIESFEKGIQKVKKISMVIMPIVVIICIILILNSKYVVNLLFGDSYVAYYVLLIPLTLWMLLGILNNFLGVQIVVASGHEKEYSIAFNWGFISLILFNVALGFIWGLYGIAVAALVAELVLTLALIYQIKKISKKFREENKLKLIDMK